MARTVKSAQERRLEIIQTSERLFRENGYANPRSTPSSRKWSWPRARSTTTSSPRTRYWRPSSSRPSTKSWFWPSRWRTIRRWMRWPRYGSCSRAARWAMIPRTRSQNCCICPAKYGELHEVTNIQTIVPTVARLCPPRGTGQSEGSPPNREATGDHAVSSRTGSQFLLDGGLFEFSDEELSERRFVTQAIVEKALGAGRGSFDFMNES